MLAGACWAGGLLLLVLLAARAARRSLRSPKRAATRAMALVAIGVVVVSGLIRAVAELGGWSGLTDTLAHDATGERSPPRCRRPRRDRARGRQPAARSATARHRRSSAAPGRGRGAGRDRGRAAPDRHPHEPGAACRRRRSAQRPRPPTRSRSRGSDFATTIDVVAHRDPRPARPEPVPRDRRPVRDRRRRSSADAVTLQLRSVTRPGAARRDDRASRRRGWLGRPGARSVAWTAPIGWRSMCRRAPPSRTFPSR